MKTVEDLVYQQPVYLHNWKSKPDVISSFESLSLSNEEYMATISPWPNEPLWLAKKEKMFEVLKSYETINILFASYGTDNYSGEAFVLFEKEGKLYEVNASHCSCFGLEHQWSPEETNIVSLLHRLEQGTMGRDSYSDNEYAEELLTFLKS